MVLTEAKYYRALDHKVECNLCPHNCTIDEGKAGICRVRKNHDGKLYTEVYGQLVARHIDPIEKKPLYHFYPGYPILSIGTAGCNLRCFFCQNCGISQTGPESFESLRDTSPGELLLSMEQVNNNLGLAFTYNEPTVFYEYMYDTAILAKEKDYKTVMISNGYISEQPLKDLIDYIDAFNIDLKAFTDDFYRKHTKSELSYVKTSLELIYAENKHLEITFLVIPGLNDDPQVFRDMISWIEEHFGNKQVLHISRYFPGYKSDIPPTPIDTLRRFREIALEKLHYVYLGNTSIREAQNSYCPNCKKLVIERGYFNLTLNLNDSGKCIFCGEKILKYI